MREFFQILVYGFGNPGRRDDGLGPELVRILEEWAKLENIPGVDFESNYQLNIEDAEIISRYDLVIFADATVEAIADFKLTELTGENGVTYTTHAASPGYIVRLCDELFGRKPKAFLLHMRGFDWDFRAGLTRKALKSLAGAVDFVKKGLLHPELFDEMVVKQPKDQ